MVRIPLQFLPAFVVVAEHASLRAASQALHLTHSAVSQQIAELESRLGFALFERRRGRLVLNAAGKLLLQSARQALADIDDGVRRAAGVARQAAGTLRLTMPVTFAQRWFLPRLGRWYEKHPDILVEVDVSNEFRDLEREGFHAALRSSNAPSPGLVRHPLYDRPSRFFAVAAPALAQRLAAGEPAALLDERLLGTRQEWAGWLAAAGVAADVEPVATFNSLTLLLNAAEQGLGIGIAREILVVDAICRDTLRPLFGIGCVREDVPSHVLVHPTEWSESQPLALLRDWLISEARASLAALDAHVAQAT